jgi:hypothetical protein
MLPSSAGGSRRPAPRAARTPAHRYERPGPISPLARTEGLLFPTSTRADTASSRHPARHGTARTGTRHHRITTGAHQRSVTTAILLRASSQTGSSLRLVCRNYPARVGDTPRDQLLAQPSSASHVERDLTSPSAFTSPLWIPRLQALSTQTLPLVGCSDPLRAQPRKKLSSARLDSARPRQVFGAAQKLIIHADPPQLAPSHPVVNWKIPPRRG